jgi:hypothetical protein
MSVHRPLSGAKRTTKTIRENRVAVKRLLRRMPNPATYSTGGLLAVDVGRKPVAEAVIAQAPLPPRALTRAQARPSYP